MEEKKKGKKTGPKPKKKAELRKPLPLYAKKKNHARILATVRPIVEEMDKE